MHVIGQAIEVAAVVLAGIAGRAVFVYFKPYRPCRWCRPGGLIGGSVAARLARYKPGRRRRRGCWRCKGHRLTRRLGAGQVHKTRLATAEAWAERGAD
jgi:hypothetical protein